MRRCDMSSKQRLAVIIGIIAVIIPFVVVGLLVTARGQEGKMQEHLDLGAQYLDELDYERAIAEYTAVLAIAPKCVDAYLGIVDAYISVGDYENALLKAKEGYDAIGDERLSRKAEEVKTLIKTALNPTPTPATTQAPAASQTAIPEPTEGPKQLMEGTEAMEIVVVEDVEEVTGNGGVIITKISGLYGAMNYTGEELVPNIYNCCFEIPNEEGYFALGDETEELTVAHVFDATGKEKLVIDNIVDLELYEEKAFYSKGIWEEFSYMCLYDMLKELSLYSCGGEWDDHICTHYATIVSDNGEFYFINGDETLYKLNEDGEDNYRVELINGSLFATMSNYSDGHAVMVENYSWTCSLLDEVGAVCNRFAGEAFWGDEYKDYDDKAYYDNGLWKENKGKLIVMSTYMDEKPQYHLLNLEYMQQDYDWGKIPNVEEVIVASFDYIQLSDSPYYLVCNGDKYFYIDENGQIVHDSFLDYSAFYGGYAMIIDTDGCAYMIDEEFNKVAGGYEADGVATVGGIFMVLNGDETIYLAPPTE